jgi:hypothetical protein
MKRYTPEELKELIPKLRPLTNGEFACHKNIAEQNFLRSEHSREQETWAAELSVLQEYERMKVERQKKFWKYMVCI